MNSIKVCEYSRSRSFHDDLILQDQASGERSQDHWSSGLCNNPDDVIVTYFTSNLHKQIIMCVVHVPAKLSIIIPLKLLYH